jgi:hypothetical protein
MSKAKELLLECKVKLGIQSDYKLAQALELHTARISAYMNGEETPDAYPCDRKALVLEKDPPDLIAELKAEPEKNEKRREFWRNCLARAKQAATLGTLALLFPASLRGGAARDREGAFFRRRYFA